MIVCMEKHPLSYIAQSTNGNPQYPLEHHTIFNILLLQMYEFFQRKLPEIPYLYDPTQDWMLYLCVHSRLHVGGCPTDQAIETNSNQKGAIEGLPPNNSSSDAKATTDAIAKTGAGAYQARGEDYRELPQKTFVATIDS